MPAASISRRTRSWPRFFSDSWLRAMAAGHAGVVEAAVLPEPGHRGVDVVVWEAAPRQALAELGFGQLAARELLESGQIGRVSQTS